MSLIKFIIYWLASPIVDLLITLKTKVFGLFISKKKQRKRKPIPKKGKKPNHQLNSHKRNKASPPKSRAP